MQIKADMLIEDIVEQYPETIGPMQEMGVQCILCGEPVWGTLEEKVRDKGLTNLDEILDRLNNVVNSKIK
jgi:methionine synthase II (cobalamin-independent)